MKYNCVGYSANERDLSSECEVSDGGRRRGGGGGGTALLEGEPGGHPQVLHSLGELLLGVLGVVVLELGHQCVQHVPGDSGL